jgi:hypothetical protein
MLRHMNNLLQMESHSFEMNKKGTEEYRKVHSFISVSTQYKLLGVPDNSHWPSRASYQTTE